MLNATDMSLLIGISADRNTEQVTGNYSILRFTSK